MATSGTYVTGKFVSYDVYDVGGNKSFVYNGNDFDDFALEDISSLPGRHQSNLQTLDIQGIRSSVDGLAYEVYDETDVKADKMKHKVGALTIVFKFLSKMLRRRKK